MNTKTLLTVKTDKSLKEAAQKVAGEIGVPLGTLVNSFLKQFVRTKEVTFSAEIPNARTRKAIADAEKDYKEGRNISPAFDNAQDAIAWLEKQNED
jgi:addiction module RelB/DinJ family antitoxin